MVVFRLHAVDAQAGHVLGPIGIVGHDHAGVAIGSQVFRRIKAKAGERSQCPGALALVFGADRLGGIFDDRHIVPFGDVPKRLHFGALAVKVHQHDGPRFLGDLIFDLQRIDVTGNRVDVGEYGFGTGAANGADGGEEGKWGQDDLVAGTNAQGVQAQQ